MLRLSACLLLLLCLFRPSSGQAQETAPLYQTEQEATLVQTWIETGQLQVSVPEAMLIAEGVQEPAARERYRATLAAIQAAAARKIKRRHKPQKRAKVLFDYLHKHVLKRYEASATLAQTLDQGIYNCVTATTLFYLLARAQEVPVQLMVTPVHVFAYVVTENQKWRIEATDPKRGFGFEEDMEEAIAYLLTYKLITSEDLTLLGREIIYDEYFSEATEMRSESLVAVAYHNVGVRFLEKEDLPQAFYAFEKAARMDTSAAYRGGLQLVLGLMLLAHEADLEPVFPFVHRAMEVMPTDSTFRAGLLPVLGAEVDHHLIEKRDYAAAAAAFEKAQQFFAGDSTVTEPLRQIQLGIYYNQSLVLEKEGDPAGAYVFARRAYATDSSAQVRDLYIDAAFIHARSQIERSYEPEGVAVLDTLRQHLPRHRRVADIYVRLVAMAAHRYVNRGQGEAAIALVQRVLPLQKEAPVAQEAFIGTIITYVQQERMIERAPAQAQALLLDAYAVDSTQVPVLFLLAGTYHELAMEQVRQSNYRAAWRLLQQALRYQPESDYIQRSVRQVKELID